VGSRDADFFIRDPRAGQNPFQRLSPGSCAAWLGPGGGGAGAGEDLSVTSCALVLGLFRLGQVSAKVEPNH